MYNMAPIGQDVLVKSNMYIGIKSPLVLLLHQGTVTYILQIPRVLEGK